MDSYRIVLNAGSAFSLAYELFTKTVEAQSNYKKDLANIAASIISIAGAGTLAWVSSAGIITANFARFSAAINKQITNTAEDVMQVALDKGVSYVVPKMPSTAQPTAGLPDVFQNDLNRKILANYQEIRGIVAKQGQVLTALHKTMAELKIEGKGNVQAEYKRYISVKASLETAYEEVRNYVTKGPKPVNQDALAKELERDMWSQWLPSLKGFRSAVPARDEFGVRDPNASYKVPTFETWFCRELKNRLINLKITNESRAEIDYWTSTEDSKKLVAWANSHTIPQRF